MGRYSYDVHVASFKVEVCLCSDTYCQTVDQTTPKTSGQTPSQTSGQTSGSSSECGAVFLVLSLLPVLFVLLMY
ncbi:hypothetical protein DPMN_142885 [Dreissena polymorpha]|uniref:Uncharacterized protein n=1 Tax=Dreissena polymorpha TaxID=45954 RepID=A0A9D4GC36_DREPO|nr:hypothetical protein DPMN_142885 [Dreissena polymorpha]